MLEAYNNILNRWVELGIFGLVSYITLLCVVSAIGVKVILNKGQAAHHVNQRLVMAAVLASLAGHMAEQRAGIPHISD